MVAQEAEAQEAEMIRTRDQERLTLEAAVEAETAGLVVFQDKLVELEVLEL
tara:strand:- start:151 stop:303 length:153 start_codon:yes stop_codon:yes gene_type:complete